MDISAHCLVSLCSEYSDLPYNLKVVYKYSCVNFVTDYRADIHSPHGCAHGKLFLITTIHSGLVCALLNFMTFKLFKERRIS